MKFILVAAALAAIGTAAPASVARQSSTLGDALAHLEGALPIVGGNEGPIIPGIAGDKARRQDPSAPADPSGNTSELENLIDEIASVLSGHSGQDLGTLLATLEGYLPVVGGNKGPIIPGLAGDR